MPERLCRGGSGIDARLALGGAAPVMAVPSLLPQGARDVYIITSYEIAPKQATTRPVAAASPPRADSGRDQRAPGDGNYRPGRLSDGHLRISPIVITQSASS